MKKISIIKGDISNLSFHVDVIVNAANSSLIPGGGVDGALNRQAGPKLKQAMLKIGGTRTGTAVYTSAYNLNADYVIHAVGPRYNDGKHDEKELLQSTYKNSLLIAKNLNVKSIAMPFISSGIYGYPLKEAIDIVIDVIKEMNLGMIIYLVAFDSNTKQIAEDVIGTKKYL